MTLETVRAICRKLSDVTEDVKWGHDLCFSVSKKMFLGVDLDPPHEVAFKCTPEMFAELVERPGIVPLPEVAFSAGPERCGARVGGPGSGRAPCAARDMWVLEQEPGETLGRREGSAELLLHHPHVACGVRRRDDAGTLDELREHF